MVNCKFNFLKPQGFAALTMGSSFWHGSHTYLGNVADNRFIDVVAFIAHQVYAIYSN